MVLLLYSFLSSRVMIGETCHLNTNGKQILCTVLILNLTVESIEPTCLTIFDKERKRIQMTCQWVQVIEGEQAHFVDAGNQVLYAHETLNVRFDGRLNLTNKCSVYIDPRDIFDERTLPVKCVTSHPKRNKEKNLQVSACRTIHDSRCQNRECHISMLHSKQNPFLYMVVQS